jgi:PIN domain nuclease of toxin-antitoxin system
MEALHLDTHAAVWLYAGEVDRFPVRLRALLETKPLFISPMVLLEIQFLREAGKLDIRSDRFLRDMKEDLDLKVCEDPYSSVVWHAIEMSWTRDPFDRLIVAQSDLAGVPLVTRDKTITQHYRRTVWD